MSQRLRAYPLEILLESIKSNIQNIIKTLIPVNIEKKKSMTLKNVISNLTACLQEVKESLLAPLMATLLTLYYKTAERVLPTTIHFILNRILYEFYTASNRGVLDVSEIKEVIVILESTVDPFYNRLNMSERRRQAFTAPHTIRSSCDQDFHAVAISNLVRPIFDHVYLLLEHISDKAHNTSFKYKATVGLLWSDELPNHK